MDRHQISPDQFAASIGYHVGHIASVLKGKRLFTIEFAHAVGLAYPQLNPMHLLATQAKWRLHQLDHPDSVPAPASHSKLDGEAVELVKKLYPDRSVSINAIREKTGLSIGSIYSIVDKADIPRRERRPTRAEIAARQQK